MATPLTITITGVIRSDGTTPDPGATVTFTPPTWLQHADGTLIEPQPVTGVADVAGAVTLEVIPSTDPAWAPVNWDYDVRIDGSDPAHVSRYRASVAHDASGGNLTLGEILDQGTPVDGVNYALVSHTHSDLVTDVEFDDTIAGLSDTYVTDAELAAQDLVSYTSLQEALVAFGHSDPQVWHPWDAGYAGWTYDGAQTQAGTIIPTGGVSHVFRIRTGPAVTSISAVDVHLTTAPTGVTNAFASLHNDAGAKLGAGAVTANRASDFTTGGMKTMPLLTPQAVTPNTVYKVRVWFTTTTSLPTLSRACNSSGAIISANVGQAASLARWQTADAGLTDAASAPDQIGTATAAPTAYWVGIRP
jgi:hypothetical protein